MQGAHDPVEGHPQPEPVLQQLVPAPLHERGRGRGCLMLLVAPPLQVSRLSRPAQLQERDSAASTGLGGSPRVCSPGCTAAVPGRSDRDGAGSAVQQAPSARGVTAHPSGGGGTSAPRLAGRGQVDTAVMAGRTRRRSGGARRDGRA